MVVSAPRPSLPDISDAPIWPHLSTGPGLKRKAEASASPQKTRRRLALTHAETQPTSPEPPPPDAIPPWPAPEPLSINGLLREHCRSRIYVKPIQWTSAQMQLLGCRFALVPSQRGTRPERAPGRPALPSTAGATVDGGQVNGAADGAAKYLLSRRSWALEKLFKLYGLRRIEPKHPSFRFGQRTVATLKTGGMFTDLSSASPSFTYLDLSDISTLRDDSIRFPKCGRSNPPFARLRQKRLRRLQPAVEAEDPYIAAILIALAQEQRQASRLQGTRATAEATTRDTNGTPSQSLADAREEGRLEGAVPSFEVHLLVLATGTRRLYFFTARFPAEFLDKFDMPSRFSPSDPLVISYSSVRIGHIGKVVAELEAFFCARPGTPEEGPAPK